MLDNKAKISLINIYKKYAETIYNRVLLHLNKKKHSMKKYTQISMEHEDEILLLEELLKEFKQEKQSILHNFDEEKEKLLKTIQKEKE